MRIHPLAGASGRLIPALVLCAFGAAGCGDDSSAADADVRQDVANDAVGRDAPMDTGRIVGAPYVVQALPEPGAVDVDPATNILILFSEAMAPGNGTLLLQPGNIEVSASSPTAQWLSRRDLGIDDPELDVAVLLTLSAPLTGGVEYTGSVQQDFRDAGGAPLAEVFEWTFQVNDSDPPFVTSASPAEGATGLSARDLVQISLEFSEQIDSSGAVARLEGGPGTLGDPMWEAERVTYPVSGLAYRQSYRVALSGFVDASGNTLDGDTYLLDGRLNFATGPDTDNPRVATSLPTEGQRGTNPATNLIRLEFDEAMNTAPITAFFEDGTSSIPVVGVWDGDRAIRFNIAGLISALGPYSLDISTSEFEDLEGNPLDLAAYLVDGALDFEVGEDVFGPRVISSDPAEGELRVRFSRTSVRVRFDEPMNPVVASANLSNGVSTTPIAATFSAGNTIASFNVAGRLQAGRAYTLDLSLFEDVGGHRLDGVPYLGDSVLNFTTQEPTGDSCREPLTSLSAERTASGALRWNISSGEYVDDGATSNCASGDPSDDVVIEYVKTSERLADGGAALSIDIEATGSDTTNLNWELREGVCEITSEEAQLICHSAIQDGGRVLDVGPGTYYIWVAKETSGTFPGANVTVSEVGGFPEGEGCEYPYDTSSAFAYIAPTSPSGPHLFQIPIGGVKNFDRDTVSNGPGNTSCADQHGADAVIRFEKSEGTILEIRAVPTDILSSSPDINVEVSRGCTPASVGYQSLGCAASFDRPTTIAATAPAGPVFIWVSTEDPNDAFPGATVSIREIPVSEGESCGSARPIGDGTVVLDSSSNLGGGTCLGSAAAVTWYSYEPTESIVVVTGNAAGSMLLTEQATDQTLACGTDTRSGLPAVIPAGSTLCIGIPRDAAITSLTFVERTYEGITGTVTDPGYQRALSATGSEIPWTNERWLASTPTTLYMADTSRVFQIAKRAGSRALEYSSGDGINSTRLGYEGLTIDERLFSVDETTSTTVNRVFELWDARTFPWAPRAWENNPEFYVGDFRSIARAATGNIIVATHDAANVFFYSLNPSAPGAATEIGSNQNINDVRSIAFDASYIYLVGDLEIPSVAGAIVRIPIAEIANPSFVPELLADVTMDGTYGPIAIDSRVNAQHLYYRDVSSGAGGNQIGVVVGPGSATPAHLGTILSLGGSSDYSMTYDETDGALYVFESQTLSRGRIVRVD